MTPRKSARSTPSSKPRIGGIGIVAATFLSAGYWLAADALPAGLVAGAVVIVAFGYLDDRYTLRVRWKFLGQILAVLLLLAGGVTIDHVPLLGLEVAPAWIRYPLSFFFVLGVINAVNMSDGLDGLAAGMVLMSIGTLAALAVMTGQDAAAVAALAVAGGVLGFLRYNTFPSRTFMGDTGSQFLGFAVAALAILVTQHPGAAVSPALPLLIAGLPVIDTLSVMALRIIRGKSPFLPDAKHLHHQFLQIGCRHHEAVAVLYMLQLALLALAWWSRYESDGFILALYLVFSRHAAGCGAADAAARFPAAPPRRNAAGGAAQRGAAPLRLGASAGRAGAGGGRGSDAARGRAAGRAPGAGAGAVSAVMRCGLRAAVAGVS